MPSRMLTALRRWRTDPRSWGSPPRFLLAFAVIAAGMILMGRDIYFGAPLFETGDLAADSLQIRKAVHLLEIHGNYSRFGFHHPGPAFLYVYGAGEVIFYKLLHLVPAPHNGQLLAAALLQSGFLAAAITVVSQFAVRNRGLFVAAAIALASLHFRLAADLELSVWPPNQLIVPFACFVVTAIAVARGRIRLLPLFVLCGGFLAHGHVAQPLFVVPLGALAFVLGFRAAASEGGLPLGALVRRHAGALLLTAMTLAVFLTPLLMDAARGSDSNLAVILTYFTNPRIGGDPHPPLLGVAYVLAFLGYPTEIAALDFSDPALGSFLSTHWAGIALSVGLLVALPIGLLVARSTGWQMSEEDEGESVTRLLRTYYTFVLLAVALCLVWAAMQRGPLYQFNSYFVYGLMFAAALPSLVLICRLWPATRSTLGIAAMAVVALSVVVTASPALPMAEDPTGLEMNEAVREVIAQRKSDEAVLLEFNPRDWNTAVGVALALQRNGVRWFVEPGNEVIFGEDHILDPDLSGLAGIEPWFLSPPAADQPGRIMLGPEIALYPPPESISTYHFTVQTVSPYVAGTYHSVVVTELDSLGNVAIGYHGTVQFTSSDPQATLPADYTFRTNDRGVRYFMFELALRTPGLQSVTVTDAADPSITGTQLVLVLSPETASQLGVDGATG